MYRYIKSYLFIIGVLLFAAEIDLAQNSFLDRVPQLQETAKLSAAGGLGCGKGAITLITTRGEMTLHLNLDPIHVFGKKVAAVDLLTLLEARNESNRAGKTNPMSGDVDELAYVVLLTLSGSKESSAVPVISRLLTDKSSVIRGWSAIALIRLAESDAGIKGEVQKVIFPKAAVESAHGRGVKLPVWAITETGS